jgi:hypothetical protein
MCWQSQSAGPPFRLEDEGSHVDLATYSRLYHPSGGATSCGFAGLIRIVTGVRGMAPSRVAMTCGFLMMPAIVMFGGFTMTARSFSVGF